MKGITGGRRRRGWVLAGLVVFLAVAVVSLGRAGAFSAAGSSQGGRQAPAAPATAVVVRRDIAAATPVAATLRYAGSYLVLGAGGGTLTWLPSAGQVVSQGQVLYRTDNGSPVALLDGSVPDWRAMSAGTTGEDVTQLNHDLVNLRYADRAEIIALGWDYYSWETAYGVQRLEEHLGVSCPAGSLALGQVVFEPEALRVSQVTGRLGGRIPGPVLVATSDRQVVTISLSTSQESEVAVGDAVTVTLPDNASTPGTISSVGRVAAGMVGNATIPVTVTLAHPSAAGSLDQAPVTVNITTATARDVLVVPVTALLAESPTRYVVEVAGPGDVRRYVRVTPGIVDDDDGVVQVTGALTPGQRVVVAAT
jgi:multidrug efflux pump subunit AcrA (membrane-fusion protein)